MSKFPLRVGQIFGRQEFLARIRRIAGPVKRRAFHPEADEEYANAVEYYRKHRLG